MFQLADDLAQASLHLRVALTVAPPQLTGDSRYDAWIAGVIELRLSQVSVPAPDWATQESRTFDGEWLVSGIEPHASPWLLRRSRFADAEESSTLVT